MEAIVIAIVGLYILYKVMNNNTVVAGLDALDNGAGEKFRRMEIDRKLSSAKYNNKATAKHSKLVDGDNVPKTNKEVAELLKGF